MRKMGSLEVKFNRFRNELQRIAADINIVQRDIPGKWEKLTPIYSASDN